MSKVPAEAKKVFDGILFDVYQQEVEQFDGTYKTFEWVRGYDIVKAICIVEGKIMIQEEWQPGGVHKIGLPGGIVEAGEDPETAIVREVHEETGILFKNSSKLIDLLSPIGLLEAHRSYYICKDPQIIGKPNPDSGGERIQTHYYTFEQFIEGIINNTIAIYELGYWIITEYYIPGKIDELKDMLLN